MEAQGGMFRFGDLWGLGKHGYLQDFLAGPSLRLSMGYSGSLGGMVHLNTQMP